MSKLAIDWCGPFYLFSFVPVYFLNAGICKFRGLHIEIVITIQATITNNTDYRAGIYFVIIMFFKLL